MRADRTERGNKASFPATSSFFETIPGNRAISSLIKPAPLEKTSEECRKIKKTAIEFGKTTQEEMAISLSIKLDDSRMVPALFATGCFARTRFNSRWDFLISTKIREISTMWERCTLKLFSQLIDLARDEQASSFRFDELPRFLPCFSILVPQGLDLTISCRTMG